MNKFYIKKFFSVIRKKIRKLNTNLLIILHQSDLKIIVGAASSEQNGWLSTNYPILDLTEDSTFQSLFKERRISAFLAEHVWEHLNDGDNLIAAENCFRYLKEGGYLRVAVPDGFHPDQNYINLVKPGGSGTGSDDHKVLYNYKSFTQILELVGFKVKLLEWFDESGIFHSIEWQVKDGFIERSTRFDSRNKLNPTAYTSLILDAVKI